MTRTRRAAACYACRQRKSHCRREAGTSTACLTCRSHGTTCVFPAAKTSGQGSTSSPPSFSQHALSTTGPLSGSSPVTAARGPPVSSVPNERNEAGQANHSTADASPFATARTPGGGDSVREHQPLPTPLSRAPEKSDNGSSSQRLVGPILGHDSQALSDFLSENPNGQNITRTMWTGDPSGWSAPIVFTTTRRRPAGLSANLNPAKTKLELMDKFLEPWQPRLVDFFLSKIDPCFPLLDGPHFKRQYENDRNSISPALLACLYAHTLTFWASDPVLANERRPDQRFVWNLANQALFAELRLSPGIPTLIAIILNVIGRPSTLVFNNAGQLGFAISLAYTLGLNRDPSSWSIPPHEKRTRVNVWQALTICDRCNPLMSTFCLRTSLAYGIPPYTRKAYADVQAPNAHFLAASVHSTPHNQQGAMIFNDFARLTDVLDDALEGIYRTDQPAYSMDPAPTNRLRVWIESTDSITRHVVLRGSDLTFPGTANLRLAFLSLQFMFHRIELEGQRKLSATSAINEELRQHYIQTRHAAEEIVLFVQELGEAQLKGFWLPFLAYPLLFVMTFLIRSAVQFEDTAAGLAGNGSFTMACDFRTHLLATRRVADWDLADLCIREYSHVLDKLRECGLGTGVDATNLQTIDALIPGLDSSEMGLDLCNDSQAFTTFRQTFDQDPAALQTWSMYENNSMN